MTRARTVLHARAAALLILSFVHLTAWAQQSPVAAGKDTAFIDLRGMAAFRAGDDETWRSKYIDEREGGWNFIPVPGAWERFGYPLLDGFAWYRVRFTIPASMRDDSLLLVMSAVDDADETYLNGVGIGRTGAFPPDARSELRSLRIYPLPRYLREEFNLLAIRVYDRADSGGITGSIFRIIRADAVPSVLDEIVADPFIPPPQFITNGTMVSAFNTATSTIEWTRPHLFAEMQPGLRTEPVLSNLTLTVERDGRTVPLSALAPPATEYVPGTGILHSIFKEGLDVWWYHPVDGRHAIVVTTLLRRGGALSDAGIRTTFDRIAWRIAELGKDTPDGRMKSFILQWHSCCEDLAQRDLDSLTASDASPPRWSLDAQTAWWKAQLAHMRYVPSLLGPDEQAVYMRSVTALLQAQVREIGAGSGQIVPALAPPSHTMTTAREHLAACEALAAAGLAEQALAGIAFIEQVRTGSYSVFAPYGRDQGVGYAYLVSPAPYTGAGEEYVWKNPRDTELRFDGMPAFILTVDACRRELRNRRPPEPPPPADTARTTYRRKASVIPLRTDPDSAFIAQHWTVLSKRVADVLLYRRDSLGLMPTDASPWGPALASATGVITSLHAAAALRIAAKYAAVMHDDLRAFLYRSAADSTVAGIRRLALSAAARSGDADVSEAERLLFHPLITDAVMLGCFAPGTPEAGFAFNITEHGFAIEDRPGLYNAQPDGDWFTRQARPLITLRLARAYAATGDRTRAEALFARITSIASRQMGLIPELIDPVSGNFYGGLPAIGSGAAEYILAAEEIARLRAPGR